MKQEVIAKEQALADIKKDYQVLRFKFQRYLAANEQTGSCRNLGVFNLYKLSRWMPT